MRIIFVSDVYQLDNLPSLKTLVAEYSAGFAKTNVFTALPGDFLAPSLLSSIDGGYSMVKAMNSVPIDLVCFGNHDGNDIPYAKLVHRIEEFNGTWLNSNMPDFDPQLPEHKVYNLTGEDGKPGARNVAFAGFLIGGGTFQSMYHPNAFGGAHRSIVPVVDAVQGVVDECRRQHPGIDEVIPLTHQDLAEDKMLADMGLFSVILGGHDHHQILEASDKTGCQVVKPGMDATHAAIIDLVWSSDKPGEKPVVTVQFQAVTDFAKDPELAGIVAESQTPILELDSAVLYELPHGEVLSSVDSRLHDCSMARRLATWVRDHLGCDGVVINAGTVRGNREHTEGISVGDLRRECPFASTMVVVRMPFSVLKEAIRLSRKKWWDIAEGGCPQEAASALQTDEGMDMVEHVPTTIHGEEVTAEETLFRIGCDSYVLGRNLVFKEYCKSHPERIPPDDAGRPLLPILVEHFCSMLWTELIDVAANQVMSRGSLEKFHERRSVDLPDMDAPGRRSVATFNNSVHKIFELFDHDRDGYVSSAELQRVLSNALGPNLSSRLVIQQLMHLVDASTEEGLTELKLRQAIRKMALND